MGLTNLSVSENGSASASGTGTGTATGNGAQTDTQSTISPTPGVIIPVYASWFDLNKIDDIERRSLPEFFAHSGQSGNASTTGPTGEKTPTLYQEYRDFMVTQYRGRPHEYLSVTMCRRHLTGDVGGIVRVHAFLEQWGLINFQVATTGGSGEGGKGRTLSTPPLYVPVVSEQLPPALANAVQAASLSFLPHVAPLRRESRVLCTSCGIECPRLYYTRVYSSNAQMTMAATATATNNGGSSCICALCYAEGKYIVGASASDYQRVDVAALEQSMRAEWSEEDTLRLLQAIEEVASGDWDAVAGRVGRPKDQCIFHFLRLPSLENITLRGGGGAEMEGEMEMETKLRGVGERVARMTPAKALPFSTTDNPVMATLAFLAAAVHPKVAAAAAQAAIQESITLRARLNVHDSGGGPGTDEKGTGDSVSTESATLTDAQLSQIAATGLSCAAARAHQFADEEAKKMTRLRDTLIDLQLQKLRVKMSLYEDLERGLEEDRKELEQQRLQLFFDRFNLKRQMLSMEQKAGLVPDAAGSAGVGTAGITVRVEETATDGDAGTNDEGKRRRRMEDESGGGDDDGGDEANLDVNSGPVTMPIGVDHHGRDQVSPSIATNTALEAAKKAKMTNL